VSDAKRISQKLKTNGGFVLQYIASIGMTKEPLSFAMSVIQKALEPLSKRKLKKVTKVVDNK